jgi:alpha-1,2-mannosyltransferase
VVCVLWLLAAATAATQAWAALSRPFDDRLADLQMYVGSVTGLVEGGSLYDYAFPPTGAPFTYPPFGGLLLVPLAFADVDALMVGWTLATIAVVVLIATLAARAPGIHRALSHAPAVPLIALLFFLSAAISSNLRFGQVSVLLVLAVMVDLLRLVPPRYVGVATGIVAALKLTPLIFIPLFWLSGQRRAALTATGVFAGGTALAWAILPGDSARFWLHELSDVNGMGSVASGGNQSLNAALLREDVPVVARFAVIGTVGAAIVVAALWRGARAWRAGDPLTSLAVVGAAGVVFSPVSWMHHQIWLVFAVLLPVSTVPWRRLAWAALVVAILVLPVTSVGASLPGGLIWGNARLLLAVAIAAFIPFLAVRRPAPAVVGAGTESTRATAWQRRMVRPRRSPEDRDSSRERPSGCGLASGLVGEGKEGHGDADREDGGSGEHELHAPHVGGEPGGEGTDGHHAPADHAGCGVDAAKQFRRREVLANGGVDDAPDA